MRKKVMAVLTLIFIALIIFYYWQNRKTGQFAGYELVTYQLKGKNVNLLIADTARKREQGLMGISKMPKGVDGMLFLFPARITPVFWNKNTLLDLDVYWLNDDQVIGQDFLPAITKDNELKTIVAPKEVDFVIELAR